MSNPSEDQESASALHNRTIRWFLLAGGVFSAAVVYPTWLLLGPGGSEALLIAAILHLLSILFYRVAIWWCGKDQADADVAFVIFVMLAAMIAPGVEKARKAAQDHQRHQEKKNQTPLSQ